MKLSFPSTLLIGLIGVAAMVVSPVEAYTDVYDCPVDATFEYYWNRGPNSAEKAITIELLEHAYNIAHSVSSTDFEATGASTASNWSVGPLSFFSSWWMAPPNKFNKKKLRASSPEKELRDTSGYTWYGIAVTVSVMLGCNVCNHADDDTLPVMELDAEEADAAKGAVATNTVSLTVSVPGGMLSNEDLEYWEGEFCYQMEDSGYNIFDFTKNCKIVFNPTQCSTRMSASDEKTADVVVKVDETAEMVNTADAAVVDGIAVN